MKKKQIGIFSGSFNPIHVGHLILGNYMCEFTHLDEVWFVVSPHNPLKNTDELLDDDVRLQMTRLALSDFENLKVSDIEFHLPRPSYTIDTLTFLKNNYPDAEFTLIIGGDNWMNFHQWKAYEQLRREFPIFIYPRLNEEIVIPEQFQKNIQVVNAPIVEVSSTFIRNSIKARKNIRAFVGEKVWEFMMEKGLYR
ncbi:MAG: nicotinate-nucleotide adenylyltransferase [Dysgonamonadaceae bacterium]|jgi:nicotinate-nucleotide adenylyltransferase|nr:nicotinate-nucleotide adenylyltransferase [Dysgonamonadaceae bacterium]